MEKETKPCPHCGELPRIYHGVHDGKYGDSVECVCEWDQRPEPWHYTDWHSAVKRWNRYVDSFAA